MEFYFGRDFEFTFTETIQMFQEVRILLLLAHFSAMDGSVSTVTLFSVHKDSIWQMSVTNAERNGTERN
jgi:hypothetical protein